MKPNIIVGITLCIMGVIMGLFLGVWWCFIGGIIQVVNAVKAGLIAGGIVAGITRIVLASLVGWVSALALILPGYHLMTKT